MGWHVSNECKLAPSFSDGRCKANANPSPVFARERTLGYALGRLPHLEACLSNRHLEIDNNAAELGMRGMAVGRKICSLQAPMAEEST